jgi:hypothetical protein
VPLPFGSTAQRFVVAVLLDAKPMSTSLPSIRMSLPFMIFWHTRKANSVTRPPIQTRSLAVESKVSCYLASFVEWQELFVITFASVSVFVVGTRMLHEWHGCRDVTSRMAVVGYIRHTHTWESYNLARNPVIEHFPSLTFATTKP